MKKFSASEKAVTRGSRPLDAFSLGYRLDCEPLSSSDQNAALSQIVLPMFHHRDTQRGSAQTSITIVHVPDKANRAVRRARKVTGLGQSRSNLLVCLLNRGARVTRGQSPPLVEMAIVVGTGPAPPETAGLPKERISPQSPAMCLS